MKSSVYSLAIVGIIVTLVFASSKSLLEERENRKQKAVATKKNLIQEYDAFKIESDEKFTSNETLILTIKNQNRISNKTVESHLEGFINALEKRNQELEIKLSQFMSADNLNIVAFKKEFEQNADSIHNELVALIIQ